MTFVVIRLVFLLEDRLEDRGKKWGEVEEGVEVEEGGHSP